MDNIIDLTIKDFYTKEDAIAWVMDFVDDPYVDNDRFAFADDDKACAAYEEQRVLGCCGEFDTRIMVNGKDAFVGCNYGH